MRTPPPHTPIVYLTQCKCVQGEKNTALGTYIFGTNVLVAAHTWDDTDSVALSKPAHNLTAAACQADGC
jgi:hypothetical protein